MYGFNDRLLDWFTSYLSDRKQRGCGIKFVECFIWCSTKFDLRTFVIFYYLSMPNRLSLFADDAKCYRKVLSHNDSQLLQNDINKMK